MAPPVKPAAASPPFPMDGIHLSSVQANGLTHRIATTFNPETSSASATSKRTLIMFLHGFPESWYSWRHQLRHMVQTPAISEKYVGCAPDMRGYGSTDSPDQPGDYVQPILAKDVIGIVSALGYSEEDKFIVVGHDFGAMLAWHVSLLYPQRIHMVCGMSVPYAGRGKLGFLDLLKLQCGNCLEGSTREEKLACKFHYILYHNLPNSAKEYDDNCREVLYRVYSYLHGSTEIEEGTPEVMNELMFPPPCEWIGKGVHEKNKTPSTDTEPPEVLDATAAPGFALRIPRAKTLPKWLTQEDLDYYVSEFERASFKGGLLWYQALNLTFDAMEPYDGAKVAPPALFVSGALDQVMEMFGGKEAMVQGFKANCEQVEDAVFVDGAGHWVQQEKAEEVNKVLFGFVERTMEKVEGGDVVSKI